KFRPFQLATLQSKLPPGDGWLYEMKYDGYRAQAANAGASPARLQQLLPIGGLWGKCPRCGSVEGWSEHERYATTEDIGQIRVRRPAGFKRVRLWRDEWYEPRSKP